jgi:SlyX protein
MCGLSTNPMNTPDTTDQRLTDLEIKASFAEDLLDELNQVIVRQQQEIDLLMREVRQLRLQMPDNTGPAQGKASEELPPHY